EGVGRGEGDEQRKGSEHRGTLPRWADTHRLHRSDQRSSVRCRISPATAAGTVRREEPPMDTLLRRVLVALAAGSLAAGCASEPSTCQSDSECGSGQLCISGTCEGEGLSLNGKSPLSVVPPTESRSVTAGVKPDDAHFSVVDSSIIPHFYSVACDSGAVP